VNECIFNTHLFTPDIFDDSWRQYYIGFRAFVAPYYGVLKHDKKTDRYQIRLRNLLNIKIPTVVNGMNTYFSDKILHPSYLDIKIGTKCVLREPTDSSYEYFKSIDDTTTTKDYGFRVTGFCVYENNSVREHVCEDFSQTQTYS